MSVPATVPTAQPSPSGPEPNQRAIRLKRAWRRFSLNRGAVLGAVILVLFVLTAILAPWLAPYSPTEQALASRLSPPSGAHWLGTDDLGRDLLSRLIFGTQVSLRVGVIAVALALVGGTALGLLAGYRGGRTDEVVMRGLDVLLAFPSILLAILVVAVLGPSLENAIVAIAIVNIPVYARLVRAAVMSLKHQEFIEASRASGAGHGRIVWHHIVPNCLTPITVQATLGIGTAILETAGLSFLGLGAQPPTPEWGTMLNDARPYIRDAWWIITFPGVAIIVTVLGFNLLGDGLRDMLDPKGRR
ncbi:MAG: nickel transporter permease [Candidatus Sericytochromatia bacterium]